MDDLYAINLAKTEFRDAYNTGDVERLLSVFSENFTDMSEGEPSFFGPDAPKALRWRMRRMFEEHRAELQVIIIAINVLGSVALSLGWHTLKLAPKKGGEAVSRRYRYMETWQKEADGKWRIAACLTNRDVLPRMMAWENLV